MGKCPGASGYHNRDPRVLTLLPETLNDICLGEIEDVNTHEGAIRVMEEIARKKAAESSCSLDDPFIGM